MRSENTFIERARRKQIIDGAIGQLADSGYAGTTLAAIANRIGVSKAAILYHFTGGKDELLNEVVRTVIDDAAEAMRGHVEVEETIAGKLRAYIIANVRYLAEARDRLLALTAVVSGAPPSPDGGTLYEPMGETAVETLTALLRAGQRTKEFGTFSAPVVARCLRGAIDALAPVLRSDPDADLDAYARELVTIFEKVVAP